METFENNVLCLSDEIADFFIRILLHLIAKRWRYLDKELWVKLAPVCVKNVIQ